jgi:hypothetical protein
MINVNKTLSKKRSWVEIAFDNFDEEQERVKLMNEIIKKIMEIRGLLLSIGEYDLEDGEVLE